MQVLAGKGSRGVYGMQQHAALYLTRSGWHRRCASLDLGLPMCSSACACLWPPSWLFIWSCHPSRAWFLVRNSASHVNKAGDPLIWLMEIRVNTRRRGGTNQKTAVPGGVPDWDTCAAALTCSVGKVKPG